MSWPRNSNLEKMHEMYLQGFSLAEVAKQFGGTRQSVWEVFKYNNKPMRVAKKREFTHFNGFKYTLRNNGYFGKTTQKRTLLHRDVYEFYNGEIPEGYDIHHIDEDKTNNKIENLMCLPKSEHTRLFSPHNNQYTIGRKKESCGA